MKWLDLAKQDSLSGLPPTSKEKYWYYYSLWMF